MARRLEEVTAAVLAGGLGTRLRSRVADRPKVLAPVGGKPYLAYLLDQLDEAGVGEVVLLTGYRAEQIRAAFGATYADLRLTYSVEAAPLGTGGAVRHALPHLHTASILVLNGDSYCAASLHEFTTFHHRQLADVSLVLTAVEDASRYGRVLIGKDDRIHGFAEKDSKGGQGWVNAGIYLLNRSLIEEIPDGKAVSLERDLFPAWATAKPLSRKPLSPCTQGERGWGEGADCRRNTPLTPNPSPLSTGERGAYGTVSKRCFGFASSASFLDIGTPQSYDEAEIFFASLQTNDLA